MNQFQSISLPGERVLRLDQPRIMGILNVTPDSFSDGGQHNEVQAAVTHAKQMIDEGAEIIDVGGESTRPGSQRVSIDHQIARTRDVVAQVRAMDKDVVISIDTTRAAVAEAAIDCGADMINDVSAGREDANMFALAASRNVPIILMHMQGEPATMQANPTYDDVVADVRKHLELQAQSAIDAGVAKEMIVIDPGIGFGKTKEHNLHLLAHLDAFVASGYPILLGTSRKRFMGSICSDKQGNPPLPGELVGATCATTALGVEAGVMLFRVHDVKANRQAADVAWALKCTKTS